MKWRGSGGGLALLILILLVLIGIILFCANKEIGRALVEAAPPQTQSLVPTPTTEAVGGFCELAYPGLIFPGPPPPGTTLIRLEIPKIEFSESVFPVGFEEREGEVVMGAPVQDTVWTLDLLDPLVREYGWGGRNYVVWAHRYPWGSRWPELGIGDKILFLTVRCSEEVRGFCYIVYYEARVFSWAIVPVEPPEAETQFYQASEEPMLTLVTCHPKGDPNPRFRLVIRAHFSNELR